MLISYTRSLSMMSGPLENIPSCSIILGKIHQASQVVPCGKFISLFIFLQECHNIVHVKHFGAKKAWSKYRQVYINSRAAFTLNLLKSLLQCKSLHIWSGPISILVKREQTFIQLTDASTKGLGGGLFVPSSPFSVVMLGFSMQSAFLIISHQVPAPLGLLCLESIHTRECY